MAKRGRPSKYTEEIAREICVQLALGRPLTKIVKDDGMPDLTTVYYWMDKHPEFSQRYARAREDQADTLADEIQAIADETMLGERRVIKANGDVEITQTDMTEHRKIRIDARKWIASKLKPKKYGDRIQQDMTGEVSLAVAVMVPPKDG